MSGATQVPHLPVGRQVMFAKLVRWPSDYMDGPRQFSLFLFNVLHSPVISFNRVSIPALENQSDKPPGSGAEPRELS